MLKYPFSAAMKRRFRSAEQLAQDLHRGIWKNERPEARRSAR
jgi:hypothetical protein